MNTVSLYIASLHHYNQGELKGEWIEVGPHDTSDDIRSAIQALLESWDVEEYAIHDYEGLPSAIASEHMSLEKVAAYTTLLDRFQKQIVEAYFQSCFHYEVDAHAWGRDIEDRILGVYDSVEEWAYERAEMAGWTDDMSTHYFDAEAFARDARLNGDITAIDLGIDTTVVFAAH